MTSEDAIRFLAREARVCRDTGAHEAFCLLLPAVLDALDLAPMHAGEALRFRHALEKSLRAKKIMRLDQNERAA